MITVCKTAKRTVVHRHILCWCLYFVLKWADMLGTLTVELVVPSPTNKLTQPTCKLSYSPLTAVHFPLSSLCFLSVCVAVSVCLFLVPRIMCTSLGVPSLLPLSAKLPSTTSPLIQQVSLLDPFPQPHPSLFPLPSFSYLVAVFLVSLLRAVVDWPF